MLHCSSFCYIKPRKAYLILEKIRRVDKVTDNNNFPRQKAGRRHLDESLFFGRTFEKEAAGPWEEWNNHCFHNFCCNYTLYLACVSTTCVYTSCLCAPLTSHLAFHKWPENDGYNNITGQKCQIGRKQSKNQIISIKIFLKIFQAFSILILSSQWAFRFCEAIVCQLIWMTGANNEK